jgi:hypothetical protein
VGSGYDRLLLLETLGSRGTIRRRVQHVAESWTPGALTVRDTLTGARDVLRDVDTLVAVEPREAVLPTGQLDDAHVIGDAVSPRTIDAAIFDAVEVAYAAAGFEELGRQE